MTEHTPEQTEDPYGRNQYDPALAEYIQTLRPSEVVAMHQAAHAAYYELPWEARKESAEKAADEGIFAVLSWLPELNLPFARDVYQALTDSPNVGDRTRAAVLVSCLTPFDHDFGLDLWRKLARDPSFQPRNIVDDELEFLYDPEHRHDDDLKSAPTEEDEAYLRAKGITFDEGRELLRLYIAAENSGPDNDINIGWVALRRAHVALGLSLTDEAPGPTAS
ncbi:hypothetical protein [Frankia sp. BMG5.23]|uniref:hypothetical protein n=1 Tax=Frankia sp. BMG5.23 TaxID=683305 RepID=UPI000461D654|nr:hypothetical protein [Frankia sp. BMG5.23]KDA44522.1 hypothetical protein BMG523Draft_00699 [Frankia sp. BMG5.23]